MGVFDLFKKRAEEPVDEPPAGAGQGPAPATEAAEAAPQQSWFGKLRTALKGLEQELGASPIMPFSSKTGTGKAQLWSVIRASYGPQKA